MPDASDHAATLRERYAGAETLDAFIARARHYPQLWRDMRARARVPDDLVDRARRLEAPRHLLVLLEDWCGDAINTIPALAALVDAVPGLELRVLARDVRDRGRSTLTELLDLLERSSTAAPRAA